MVIIGSAFILAFIVGLMLYSSYLYKKNQKLLPDEPVKEDEVHIEGEVGAMDEKVLVEYTQTYKPWRTIKLLMFREQKQLFDTLGVSDKADYVRAFERFRDTGKVPKPKK